MKFDSRNTVRLQSITGSVFHIEILEVITNSKFLSFLCVKVCCYWLIVYCQIYECDKVVNVKRKFDGFYNKHYSYIIYVESVL